MQKMLLMAAVAAMLCTAVRADEPVQTRGVTEYAYLDLARVAPRLDFPDSCRPEDES